jgi:hypothetical protein
MVRFIHICQLHIKKLNGAMSDQAELLLKNSV